MAHPKHARGDVDDDATCRASSLPPPLRPTVATTTTPLRPAPPSAVVWRGPRAVAISPAILAWLSPCNEFFVSAPVFTYAYGPVIEVCDYNTSVRVTWTWAPLSTVVEPLCREQCSFAALQRWGVAANRTNSPEFAETRVVPVPVCGVRIRARKNVLDRAQSAEDNSIVAIYSTNLSEPEWHDRVAPPRILLAPPPPAPAEAHIEVKPEENFLADTD